MEISDAFTLTYEAVTSTDSSPFPKTTDPVHILGRSYSSLYDEHELLSDVESKVWMTYRRNFSNISGTGPNSDQNWGCMLRCGQMILAEALSRLQLGRDWKWDSSSRKSPVYQKLLQKFQDKKDCVYSIHQIAAMGRSEGKEVGEWFGPNTVTQVIRKLSSFDESSNLILHIAMDNTVVVDDIRRACKSSQSGSTGRVRLKFEHSKPTSPQTSMSSSYGSPTTTGVMGSDNTIGSMGPPTATECTGSKADIMEPRRRNDPLSDSGEDEIVSSGTASSGEPCSSDWSPLLLIIPLRLGLADLNEIYIKGIQACFQIPQCVGIIGGRPNHAHWFIGTVGNDLVFLDPHTTQPFVDLDVGGNVEFPDRSYHCSSPGRVHIKKLDPSLALGFLCQTELELDKLLEDLNKTVNKKTPLFEVVQTRPSYWPASQSSSATEGTNTAFTVVRQPPEPQTIYDEEEDYELVLL